MLQKCRRCHHGGSTFTPPLCEVHQGSVKTLKPPPMMILSGAFICCLMLVVGQSGPREFLKGGRGGILEVTTPQGYKPTPTPTPPADAGLDSGVYNSDCPFQLVGAYCRCSQKERHTPTVGGAPHGEGGACASVGWNAGGGPPPTCMPILLRTATGLRRPDSHLSVFAFICAVVLWGVEGFDKRVSKEAEFCCFFLGVTPGTFAKNGFFEGKSRLLFQGGTVILLNLCACGCVFGCILGRFVLLCV